MFIIVGIVIPLFQVFWQYIYSVYGSTTPEETSNSSPCSVRKVLIYCAEAILPFRLKTLTPHQPQNEVRLLSLDRLIVRCSSYLAVLLAFGVLFPPLAVVALVSIYAITYFEQFVLSKVLVESKRMGYTWYQEQILKECENIAESWFDTLKIILPFASFSFALVVFDTLGDKFGWQVATWPSLFVFSLPWCFHLWRRMLRPMWQQFCIKSSDVKGNNKVDEPSCRYEDLFVIVMRTLVADTNDSINHKSSKDGKWNDDFEMVTRSSDVKFEEVQNPVHDQSE
jgi:hypothetical protein